MFNTPYMCPNILCDGWRDFEGETKQALNTSADYLSQNVPFHNFPKFEYKPILNLGVEDRK